MFGRDRKTTKPTAGLVATQVNQTDTEHALDRLDDAQVMELASNVYWALLEQFISLDGKGANPPSTVRAN